MAQDGVRIIPMRFVFHVTGKYRGFLMKPSFWDGENNSNEIRRLRRWKLLEYSSDDTREEHLGVRFNLNEIIGIETQMSPVATQWVVF